jgi:DNA repair protein RadD
VFSAALGRRELRQITIASRDTIGNLAESLGHFDVIIVDEAHNIAPGEETRYRKIFEGLKKNNPHLTIIGFTATPYRASIGFIYGDDEKKHLFRGLAYEAKIKTLMDQGFLCKVVAKTVDDAAVADVSEVKTTAGDYNLGELANVVESQELISAACAEWKRLAYDAGRRSSVFFCTTVLHAELVSAELHRMGFDVPVITGVTKADERDSILADFMDGRVVGVANVGVLTEGWDAPRLDCVVLLRPTKSLNLYLQMVGRGLRKHISKTDTLVLDFGGNIERFGPIDLAQPATSKTKDERTKTCPGCKSIVGFHKRKCPDCGFVFTPQPVKLCPSCGEENAPSAAKCIACGTPFINHNARAAKGGILSDENVIESYSVDDVSVQSMVSTSSGNQYLKVIYRSGLDYYTKSLMIGYEGYAGKKAVREWESITYTGTPIPTDPAHAVRMASMSNIFRPVSKIHVNTTSKWRDIVAVEYAQ